MRSIRWKLGGALLLVALLSVGMVAFLTYVSMAREFGHYISRGGSMYAGRVASVLGQYYAEEQSWDGVGETLGEFWLPPGDYRLIVADSSRAVVGDTAGGWLGEDAAVVGLEDGASITVSGEEVGELYLMLPEGVSPGKALLFMRGMGGGPPTAGIAEHAFLSNVNRSLWTVALIAVAVAILLGLVLTRQITRPLQALTAGARRIAQGHLDHRVESASKDELGELAESFNAMAVSLEENEKARRRLVADIAHELRTPLAVVEGTVDGILDGVFQPDAEHLGSVKEQTALLTRLIADLRDISLAESGQLKLEREPTDMAELVRRKVSQGELGAREKDIQLEFTASPDLPEVSVDPARMEQVIANLLANAMRHTPGGGRVTVSVSTVAGDSAHGVDTPSMVVSVADTGEGIAPEHLPHVFERFYRAESSRSRSEGGAGLGLAIVRQMVQAHGGQVWAESEAGRGSTFYVAIPLVG